MTPLDDYPSIYEKCSNFPDGHPLKIASAIDNKALLIFFESLLSKLRKVEGLPSKIIEIKNDKENFNSYVSELKVAAFLIDKVDKLKIIVPKNSSPDFEIEILGKTITIEVKRIEDKMETLKGNVEYDPTFPGLPYKIDDISTIHSKIKESIIEKKQYCQNIPHVIIFDYTPGVGEGEFEDVLYPEKDTLQQIRSKSGKLMGYGHPLYDGLFYKKNGEGNFIYSCLSGVAVIFEGYSISINTLIIKSPRIVFFKNPNAELEIEEGILSSLGMEIYKRKEI